MVSQANLLSDHSSSFRVDIIFLIVCGRETSEEPQMLRTCSSTISMTYELRLSSMTLVELTAYNIMKASAGLHHAAANSSLHCTLGYGG
jgi:hypothetical protein